MQSNYRQRNLFSAVAAIGCLWASGAFSGPMDEVPAPALSQQAVLSDTVSFLERNCGALPYCGAGEPLLVTLLEGWERDVRLKLADLVAVRFGFTLPEQYEQFSAPTNDWAPVFYSDYQQVTVSSVHTIDLRRLRHEPWR